jgi:hypothetical protein
MLLGACLVAGHAAADTAPRLYTNADLDALGSVPAQTERIADASETRAADWQFVTDFLDRQHARLDAERSLALERRRVEQEEAYVEDDHYVFPAGWGYGYGWWGAWRPNVPGVHPPRHGLHPSPHLAPGRHPHRLHGHVRQRPPAPAPQPQRPRPGNRMRVPVRR